MPRKAIVNYHVIADQRQAYHIDAGGVQGKIISPPHAVTEVNLYDVRAETSVSFSDDSIGFVTSASEVHSFEQDDEWHRVYDQELDTLLSRNLGAKEVVVFDHTVRVDDPNSNRKPARNVHSDYSPQGAKQRLIDVLGEKRLLFGKRGIMPLLTCGVRFKTQSIRPRLGLYDPRQWLKPTGCRSIWFIPIARGIS